MTEPRKSVLVVDDASSNIDVLRDALKREYIVRVAINGPAALRIVANARPDLVLLDIMMPGMDGFEVCRRLKADPVTRDIPVIFVTGLSEVADEARGLELGAVDYIIKPFRPALVRARVRIHLELKQHKDDLKDRVVFLQILIDTIPNPIFFKDREGRYLGCNKAFEEYHRITREALVGHTVYELMAADEGDIHHRADERLIREAGSISYEFQSAGPDGSLKHVIASKATFSNNDGTPGGIVAVLVDITDRKRLEEESRAHHEHLELLVAERTHELDVKTRSLEDANAAMRALLKVREEDVKLLGEKVLMNVRSLVLPYIGRFKENAGEPGSALVEVLESNLNNILSPFMGTLSSRRLTPTETQIANLIRNKKTTKEIAGILCISPRSVERHRYNIRKKLAITNKDINLYSELITMS